MGRHRGKDANTAMISMDFFGLGGKNSYLTREALSLRVTMIMGHTGRYLDTMRAD